MTRRLRIRWRPGSAVTARLAVPGSDLGPAILLAHGAGAGQDHPFVAGLRGRFVAAGHLTMTFDYPYVEAGRRVPDHLEVLAACHRAALTRLTDYGRDVVLAGKSMGGRISSHLAAAGAPAVGLACYGYPLISPGRRTVRSTEHLDRIDAPMLFVTGARDALAPLEALEPIVSRLPRARLRVVAEADHSFRMPKRAGVGEAAVLDLLVSETLDWMFGCGLRPGGAPSPGAE